MKKKTNVKITDSINNKAVKIITVEEDQGLCTVSTQYRGLFENGVFKQTVDPRVRVTCNVTKMRFDVSVDEVNDTLLSIYKIREYLALSPAKTMVGRGVTVCANGKWHPSMVWISLDSPYLRYGIPYGKGVGVWYKQGKLHIKETSSFYDAVSCWKEDITTPFVEEYLGEEHMISPRIVEDSQIGRKLTKKDTINGAFRILADWLRNKE